jgi:hypothetical protein
MPPGFRIVGLQVTVTFLTDQMSVAVHEVMVEIIKGVGVEIAPRTVPLVFNAMATADILEIVAA